MSDQTKRLTEIASLTEAEFHAKRTRMAALATRAAALREQLARIERDKAAMLVGLDPASPAGRAGAALSWEQWIDSRRTELNLELARTLVQIDKARRDLARSYGRNEAVDALRLAAMRRDRYDAEKREESGRA